MYVLVDTLLDKEPGDCRRILSSIGIGSLALNDSAKQSWEVGLIVLVYISSCGW